MVHVPLVERGGFCASMMSQSDAAMQVATARTIRLAFDNPAWKHVGAWAAAMSHDVENDNGEEWIAFLRRCAAEPAPSGVFVVVIDSAPYVLAAGAVISDHNGAGTVHDLPGHWLAGGHVRPSYWRLGLHRRLIAGRIAAIRMSGSTAANVCVWADNRPSLLSCIGAGFIPAAIGPDLDPGGIGKPTVFLTLAPHSRFHSGLNLEDSERGSSEQKA